MRKAWVVVFSIAAGCSGSGAEPVEAVPEAPVAEPFAGPAPSATSLGSCTLPEFGSCQTFYSDSLVAATAADQCADMHGIWSDVCPPQGVLAVCVTLDGRPLGAFYPPQPQGDFGVGCTQLGGRLAD